MELRGSIYYFPAIQCNSSSSQDIGHFLILTALTIITISPESFRCKLEFIYYVFAIKSMNLLKGQRIFSVVTVHFIIWPLLFNIINQKNYAELV